MLGPVLSTAAASGQEQGSLVGGALRELWGQEASGEE